MTTAPSSPTKPSFGFGSLDDITPDRAPAIGAQPERAGRHTEAEERPRARSAQARPSAPKPRIEDLRAADRAAERQGFPSREATIRRRKRQPIEEPVDQINLRAAIADINRFVGWCEERRYTYREGFGELVKLIDAA